MIKVNYDHQAFILQKYGGVSRYFYEIAKRVNLAEDFASEVVAPVYFNSYLKQGGLPVTGRYLRYYPKTGRLYTAINNLLTPGLIRYKKPDIVHETYYSKYSNAPENCPVVITVYDMIHEKFESMFPANTPTLLYKQTAVNRANRVICISEHTKKDLIQLFGIAEEKITVIYLGFDLIKQPCSLLPEEMTRKPYLLYVGDRLRYKNFSGLVKAYAQSSKLKSDFNLVAFGARAFNQEELSLFKTLGLQKEQIHHVQGNDGVLAALYSHATLFVYPSLYEGFGIPPLEAMSFNCPVVCSNISSIPEVVGNAAEMFDPYEPDSIRMAIERVIDDNLLRHTLIANGQERIKLFSWQRCTEETLDVYRRVLS